MAKGDAPFGRRLGPPKTVRGSPLPKEAKETSVERAPVPQRTLMRQANFTKRRHKAAGPAGGQSLGPGAGEPRRGLRRCLDREGWGGSCGLEVPECLRLEPPALGRPQAVEGCPTKVCVRVEMGREAAAEPGTFLLSPAQSVRDSSGPSARPQASVLTSVYPLTSCLTIAGTHAAAAANAWHLTSPPMNWCEDSPGAYWAGGQIGQLPGSLFPHLCLLHPARGNVREVLKNSPSPRTPATSLS